MTVKKLIRVVVVDPERQRTYSYVRSQQFKSEKTFKAAYKSSRTILGGVGLRKEPTRRFQERLTEMRVFRRLQEKSEAAEREAERLVRMEKKLVVVEFVARGDYKKGDHPLKFFVKVVAHVRPEDVDHVHSLFAAAIYDRSPIEPFVKRPNIIGQSRPEISRRGVPQIEEAYVEVRGERSDFFSQYIRDVMKGAIK